MGSSPAWVVCQLAVVPVPACACQWMDGDRQTRNRNISERITIPSSHDPSQRRFFALQYAMPVITNAEDCNSGAGARAGMVAKTV